MSSSTTRRLMLARHAKAVEEDIAGDHARALNSRGQDDAAALGAWIEAQHLWPQLVLCSTAVRTRQTLAALGKTLPTELSDRLYLASAGELLAQVQAADDAVTELMVLAHNPGLHGLLALLAGDYAQDADADRVMLKFPTSACAVLTFNLGSWRDVAPRTGVLTHLHFGH